MLELINDLPDHATGVRARGEVTREDVETVLLPAIDELVSRTDAIYYLLVLDTDVQNWDAGAWMSDAKLGLKHFTKWKKIAVVTDQKGVQRFSDLFSALVPGESRGFSHEEEAAARQWLAEKE